MLYEVITTDLQIGEKLDSVSHIEYEIVRPINYSEKRDYPIIFVFHGNGRNIQKAKQTWTSETLSNDYITVYLQSYIHINPYDFKWTLGDEKTTTELIKIYSDVVKSNSFDKSKIIFAGMSAGGIVITSYSIHYTKLYD